MNIILYIMTVCVWGSTWFVITFQLGTVSSDVSIFYRFALAVFLIFGWCFYRRLNLKFSLKHHLFFAAMGFFMFSMNYMSSYVAMSYIPSGLNAIGFSIVLIFNIINSVIFFRTSLTPPLIVGALCGMIGIGSIFWPSISSLDLDSESIKGIGFSLFAALLASLGNIIAVKAQKNKLPITETNAYGMAYGTMWIFLFILLRGSPFDFEASYPYVLSLIYLSIFGTIVAFGCYLTLLGRIGPSKASYVLVITPVVALCLSSFFEGFIWDFYTFTGIALIILGNVIISIGKTVHKPKPAAKTA